MCDWSKLEKVEDFCQLRKISRTVALYVFKLSYRIIDQINLLAPRAQRTNEKEAFLLHSTFCGIQCIRVIFCEPSRSIVVSPAVPHTSFLKDKR